MNTTTIATLPTATATATNTRSNVHLSPARVVRSEWIKLRSVRSTIITFGFAGVAVAAFGVIISMFTNGNAIGADGEVVMDPAGNSLFGTNIAQLVLGVLGALLITTEYSTGLIRATFAAVPKRLPVLWAKVAVLAAASFVVMLASVTVAFFAGQALYGGDGAGASLFDPGVPRALLGAALFPTAIAVMGLALGTLMRHTATAVGTLFGVLFIVPLLLQALGGVWVDVASYMPSEAGQAMTTLAEDPQRLAPLAGFAVAVGWGATLLSAAAVTLKRRDA